MVSLFHNIASSDRTDSRRAIIIQSRSILKIAKLGYITSFWQF